MKNVALFCLCLVVGIVLPFLLLKTRPPRVSSTPTLSAIAPLHSKFSLANAPSESLRGNATNILGEVLWTSRVATEAARITTDQTIQQGESLETGKKSQ